MSEEYSGVKYFRTGKVDSRAEVVGRWELDPNKLPYDYIKYYYDDKGRVAKFEKYERDFGGTASFQRLYKYEGDSRSVKESEWFDKQGRLTGVHRYYCDEKGLMVKRDETDGTRKVKYYIKSKYDEYNRLIEEAWYEPDDKLSKRDFFTYESPETSPLTPSTEEKYNGNNELTGTFEYTWDERNNLLDKRWHDRHGTLQSYYVHEYNDNDQLIKLGLYHEDDSLQMVYHYKYDDVGNKILEESFDKDGNLLRGRRWSGVFLEKKEGESEG